jgi:hypothetical protein
MACLDFKKFEELILAFDQKTIIDQDKDKPLRYDVWKTTSEEVKNLLGKLDTNALPNKDQSPRILRKIEGALRRIRESSATGGSIQKDIFDSDTNIEMSTAEYCRRFPCLELQRALVVRLHSRKAIVSRKRLTQTTQPLSSLCTTILALLLLKNCLKQETGMPL